MKKNKFYLLLYFLIFFLNGCNAQNNSLINNKNILVFKVEYKNSSYKEHQPITYALINADKICSFVLNPVNLIDSLGIIYYLTKNGGFYISETFTDVYALGCCEYDNIQMALSKIIDKTLPNEKLIEYKNVNGLSLEIFNKEKGAKFEFQKVNENYNITVWSVDLNYCVCDLYMETPSQKIFDKKAAYIRDIRSIKKPTSELRKKIKFLLKKIIG